MASSLIIKTIFRGVDRMSATIARMQNKFRRFSRVARRGMKKLNTAATKVGHVLNKSLKAAGIAAAALGVAIWKVTQIGATFEQKLVAATVKLPGNIRRGSEAYKEIEQVVRQTGKTTEFSATQTAEAVDFLAMAGFNAEQSIKALPGVVDLATVANVELGQATDIASDALGTMGLMVDDATQRQKNLQRVTDVMSATFTSANTSMTSMFEAMVTGGSIATSSGASLETFSALVGQLATSQKGGKAGTTIGNLFTSLTAQTPKAAKQLEKLKVKTAIKGDFRDIIDIIEDLNNAMKDMGTAERPEALKKIFGKESLAGITVLLDIGADKLRAYRDQVDKSTKLTSILAAEMRNTTQGSVNNLTSAIEGVIISLFKLDNKGIKGVIDAMTEWVRINEKLIVSEIREFLESIKENFDDIVWAVKAVGVTIGILYGIIAAIKILNAVTALFNVIVAANPIVLIILAIIAAIALVTYLLVKYWDDIVAGFDWLVEQFKVNIQRLGDFFGDLGASIKSIWDSIVNYISEKITSVIRFFKPAVDMVKGLLGIEDSESNESGNGGVSPQMVSPQDRTVSMLEERRMTMVNRAEVTIWDDTGRAKLTKGQLGTGMSLQPTGTF